MTLLDFAAIKAKLESSAQTLDVTVQEWDGNVRLRKMDAVAGMAITRKHASLPKDAKGNIREDADRVEFYVTLLANSIVDEEGTKIFHPHDKRPLLSDLTIGTLTGLAIKAMELNDLIDKPSDDQPSEASDEPAKKPKKNRSSKNARTGHSPSN